MPEQEQDVVKVLSARIAAARSAQLAVEPNACELTVRFIPGQFRWSIPCTMTGASVRSSDAVAAADVPAERAPEDVPAEPDEEPDELPPDDPTSEEEGPSGDFVVDGVMSSTSVDWYGTEMSGACLQDMADQCRSGDGVCLLPRHGGFFDDVNWDEELGRTTFAEVVASQVEAPADVNEQGFTLRMLANVYADAPLGPSLWRRLRRKRPVGLSIGGWFLQIRVIYAEEPDEFGDRDVERVIVDKVLLDHVAVVRNPANPDSVGLGLMRDVMRASRSAGADRHPAPVTASAPVDAATPGCDTPSNDVPDSATRSEESATMSDQQTNEKLDALIAAMGGVTGSIATLGQRLTALETRAAVAPATPAAEPTTDRVSALESEIVALRAQVTVRDNALADLAGSGRVGATGAMRAPGIAGHDRAQATWELDEMVRRAAAAPVKSPALIATVSRHKDAIVAATRTLSGHLPSGEQGRKALAAANDAHEILRSLLVSAEMDGLIGNFQTGWAN